MRIKKQTQNIFIRNLCDIKLNPTQTDGLKFYKHRYKEVKVMRKIGYFWKF